MKDRDVQFALGEETAKVNPTYQTDANRRDRLLEEDERRRRAGARQPSRNSPTPAKPDPQQENLRKMRDALDGLPPRSVGERRARETPPARLEVNFIRASLWDKVETAEPSEF